MPSSSRERRVGDCDRPYNDALHPTGALAGPIEGMSDEIRFVQQMPLAMDLQSLVAPIEQGFEAMAGVDGTFRWFTRTEGSSDYLRLVRELPTSYRIE